VSEGDRVGRSEKGEAIMAANVRGIPEGFHTITPHLVIQGAAKAIDFYKRAFGAEELMRMPSPDGTTIGHADLKIGNSRIFVCDECPEMNAHSPAALKGTPVTIHLYVEDCDKVFKQAVSAGAQVTMPLTDMFWGDRYGTLKDPFGHHWSIGTRKENLTPEQIGQRMASMCAGKDGPG
jgi:uncharacterized glyoxalase superfamily protein PhnB